MDEGPARRVGSRQRAAGELGTLRAGLDLGGVHGADDGAEHAELVAIPEAWTSGTAGPIRAKAARLKVESADELEKLKGKYAGTIVFFGTPREIGLREKPDAHRYDEAELEKEGRYEMPGGQPRYNRAEYAKRRELRKAVTKFLEEEKALAVVSTGRGDMGTSTSRAEAPGRRATRMGCRRSPWSRSTSGALRDCSTVRFRSRSRWT